MPYRLRSNGSCGKGLTEGRFPIDCVGKVGFKTTGRLAGESAFLARFYVTSRSENLCERSEVQSPTRTFFHKHQGRLFQQNRPKAGIDTVPAGRVRSDG
jgi:hypothetical protein